MTVFRRNRHRVAWLAIVALLCNTLAVFAPAKAAHVVIDDVLGPMVLCASHADAPVTDDRGAPAPAHSKSSHCPSCMLAKHLVLVLTAPVADFPAPPRGIRKLHYAPTPGIAVHLSPGGIRSRAPPHQA